MLTTLVATLALAVSSAAPAEPPSIESILETEGAFAFSDGSSVYQFFKDGKFRLLPAGMSGRTVEGVWKQPEAGSFVVTGRWSWLNGISPAKDFRRMKLSVTVVSGEAQTSLANEKLYPVYFIIDELKAVSEGEFRKASAAPQRH